MVSSFEFACDKSVGVVDECCDSATDAIEFNLSRRQGGGSLPCDLSLPLDVLPGVIVLLLLLLCRNRAWSNFVLLDTSANQERHVSSTVASIAMGTGAMSATNLESAWLASP